MNKFTKWLAAGFAAAALMAGACWFVNARAGKVEIGEPVVISNNPNNIPNNPNNPTISKMEQVGTREKSAASCKNLSPEPVKPPAPKFVANEKIPLAPWLQFKLREICENNGVPLHIALGVIEQESRFTADAYNDGCYGYMQVSSIHAPVDVLKNPVENIRLGCGLLGLLHRKYKDWNMALVCYNCGEAGAYNYYFQYGKYSSEYSRTVLLRADRWKRELGE